MSDVANSARFISVLVTTYLVITKAEIKRAPFATTDISLSSRPVTVSCDLDSFRGDSFTFHDWSHFPVLISNPFLFSSFFYSSCSSKRGEVECPPWAHQVACDWFAASWGWCNQSQNHNLDQSNTRTGMKKWWLHLLKKLSNSKGSECCRHRWVQSHTDLSQCDSADKLFSLFTVTLRQSNSYVSRETSHRSNL